MNTGSTDSTGGPMITIDTRSALPIFEQIFYQVRKMIALQIFKPEDQLPTVRQLARDLGVNPNTISKAYALCEVNGLIISTAGRGYFVNDTSIAVNNALDQYKEQIKTLVRDLTDLGFDKETILHMVKGELYA